jgi:glucose-1-phosphate cytidylyltransferase
VKVHQANAEPWKVTLVETGEETQIGGRIKRILPHIRRRRGVLRDLR